MLILSLRALEHGPVQIRGAIAADDPVWAELGVTLNEPLRVEANASMVGEGVLIRGTMESEVATECRRCLTPVPVRVRDDLDLLFEPLTAEEEADLRGEIYPLPERGDELDLSEAIREQFLEQVPEFTLCSETCRGLCPQCGAELNRMTCDCVPVEGPSPWDGLKGIKFD